MKLIFGGERLLVHLSAYSKTGGKTEESSHSCFRSTWTFKFHVQLQKFRVTSTFHPCIITKQNYIIYSALYFIQLSSSAKQTSSTGWVFCTSFYKHDLLRVRLFSKFRSRGKISVSVHQFVLVWFGFFCGVFFPLFCLSVKWY